MNDNMSNKNKQYIFDDENTPNEGINKTNEYIFLEEDKDLYENKDDNKNIVKYILMGVILAVIVLLIIFLLPKGTTITKDSLEAQIKESSKQYFDKYMSINDNTNEYIVTLDMLENANKQGEKYNLKGLEKCKKQTTLSKIIVDSKTRETKKIEVELNC